MSELRNCPDCGVKAGTLHQPGCDVERCPDCGGQMISCGCSGNAKDRIKPKDRIEWTGTWPGEDECIEYGMYSKFVGGEWIKCAKDDPLARPDLNTLMTECRWSKKEKRFVKRKKK